MGTWGTTSATVGDITFKGAASTGTSLTIGAALSVGAVSTAAATAGTFTITLNDSTTIGTTMTGGAGIDIFTGTGGADIISTGAAADTLIGGSGDDTLTDAAGASSATGGAGADTISMGAGNDTVGGGTGADTITLGEGADSVIAGAGADTITLTETTSAADIVKWSGTDDGAIATETGVSQGDVDYASGSAGDTVVGFTSGTDKLYFAAAGLTNAIGTEADTLITIAAAGTVPNTARFVEITTAFDGTTGDAITDLNALTTTAVAVGDSFVAFMNDGTDGYLFFVEQVSTANTIDSDDVTLIGKVSGVTDVATGDFVSF
jgi:hypothetical protein